MEGDIIHMLLKNGDALLLHYPLKQSFCKLIHSKPTTNQLQRATPLLSLTE